MRVSVVLPVRDGARYVRAALDSVLGQTLEDLEVIVVDDGSTDETPSILGAYDDARLRVVGRPARGLVPALNEGFALARAPLVARMDADDVSAPTRLERQVAWMNASQHLGMVASWSVVVDEHDRELRRELLPSEPSDLARRLLLRNPFRHGSAVLRKAAVDAVGGYRASYGHNEDYDLWRRLVGAGWELGAVPEFLYRYRSHGASVTNTDPRRRDERERLRDELWAARLGDRYRVREVVRSGGRYRRGFGSAGPEVARGHLADQRALVREAVGRRRPLLAAKALVAATMLARRS